jgi:hypothetical protein
MNNLKFADVAHHYLGCEVVVDGAKTKLTAYHLEFQDFSTIKPLLRSLDSMTEDEFEEFKKLADGDCAEMVLIPSMSKVGETRLFKTFNASAYLLSKHFDLFNLIPSGEAEDKNK